MNTPITRQRIQHHIAYSWWKYALLVVFAVMGWSLLFAVTRYQPPEDKKIVMGVYGSGNQVAIDQYMGEMGAIYLPEMELMNSMVMADDPAYGAAVLTTRIAARDCDVYIFPKDVFQNYAELGAFLPLEDKLPDLVQTLTNAGIPLSRGWRASEDEGKHLYGIPCTDLPGLDAFIYPNADDYYACVFFMTENDENVLRFFDIFIRDMMNEPVVTPTDLQEGL